MVIARHAVIAICLAITCSDAQTAPVAQQAPATRRSQRVQMTALDVQSPDGQVTCPMPSASRSALGNTTVIESSPIVMTLDGYDLSAGVVLGGVARDLVQERYPWSGVRSTAISVSNRARLSLTNDLTSIAYTLSSSGRDQERAVDVGRDPGADRLRDRRARAPRPPHGRHLQAGGGLLGRFTKAIE